MISTISTSDTAGEEPLAPTIPIPRDLFMENLESNVLPLIARKAKEHRAWGKRGGLYMPWNDALTSGDTCRDDDKPKTLPVAYDDTMDVSQGFVKSKNKRLLRKHDKPLHVTSRDPDGVTIVVKRPMTFRNHETLVWVINQNRRDQKASHLYEVIIGLSRFYFDIDGPLRDDLKGASEIERMMHGLKVAGHVKRVLTAWLALVLEEAPSDDMWRISMQVHTKISLHLVLCGYGATDLTGLRAIWEGPLLDSLVERLWPSFKQDLGPNASVHTVFDSLWKSMQQFRLPHQTKIEQHPMTALIPVGSHPLTDYMATYIHDEKPRAIPTDLDMPELWPTGYGFRSRKRPRAGHSGAALLAGYSQQFQVNPFQVNPFQVNPWDATVPECIPMAATAVMYDYLSRDRGFDPVELLGGLEIVQSNSSFWTISPLSSGNRVGVPCLQCSNKEGLVLGGLRIHEKDNVSITITKQGDVRFCCPRHPGKKQITMGNIKSLLLDHGMRKGCRFLLQAGMWLQTGKLLGCKEDSNECDSNECDSNECDSNECDSNECDSNECVSDGSTTGSIDLEFEMMQSDDGASSSNDDRDDDDACGHRHQRRKIDA